LKGDTRLALLFARLVVCCHPQWDEVALAYLIGSLKFGRGGADAQHFVQPSPIFGQYGT